MAHLQSVDVANLHIFSTFALHPGSSHRDYPIFCSASAEAKELMASKAVCAAFMVDDSFQYSLQIAEQLLKAGSNEAHDSIHQATALCKSLADIDALSLQIHGITILGQPGPLTCYQL
jgi:hypothetical protein